MALESVLTDRGWETRTTSTTKKRLFRSGTEWMVVSAHQVEGAQLDKFNAMVDDLDALAALTIPTSMVGASASAEHSAAAYFSGLSPGIILSPPADAELSGLWGAI